MEKHTKLDFTDQSIYVGIDVHKESWTVSVYTAEFEHKTFVQPPSARGLAGYLTRYFPEAAYYAAYEAGYSGFWIHDQLWSLGVQCSVIHPADIPTKDKERRRKSDPRDSRKLARGLRSGELDPIHVPSVVAREDRGLVRMRFTVAKEQRRIKNRIKGLLLFHGESIPRKYDKRYWSGAFIHWLSIQKMHSVTGRATLQSLLRQLKMYRDEQARILKEIKQLAHSDVYSRLVKCLMSIPGIGLISAMTWLTELVDIHRFKRFDCLTSYVGIVPRQHASGDHDYRTGLDHRGNRLLRKLLIENSWIAVRKDPALIMAYAELTKRMVGNRAIIRISRKLLRRIHFVLRNEVTYEIGVA